MNNNACFGSRPETPAPPAAMVGYSARLATSTTIKRPNTFTKLPGDSAGPTRNKEGPPATKVAGGPSPG